MSGKEIKEGKKTLLDLTEDDLKSLLTSSFSEALSKLESKKEKEEPKVKAKTDASELTVREIIEHALSCPECGKPLRDFFEKKLTGLKEEILKEVKETAKKEETSRPRRGGLFEW